MVSTKKYHSGDISLYTQNLDQVSPENSTSVLKLSKSKEKFVVICTESINFWA
jgi:hypothetical protein